MFKLLTKAFRSLTNNRDSFFPSQFNDPLALEVDWTPARSGGANFQTRKLVKVDPNRIVFRSTITALVFSLIFLLLGSGMLIAFAVQILKTNEFSFEMETIGLLFAGCVFALAGGLLLYLYSVPIVFDKRKGCFWKGKNPDRVGDRRTRKNYADLKQIHALQLISEYVRGNKSSYYSYELNLVLKNGKRICVVDHGNLSRLREDAKTLAKFLERPVWDAT